MRIKGELILVQNKQEELMAAKQAVMAIFRSFVLQLELLGLTRTEIASGLNLPRSSLRDALGESSKTKKLETLHDLVEKAAHMLHQRAVQLEVLPGNGTPVEVGDHVSHAAYVLNKITPIIVSEAEVYLVMSRTYLLIRMLQAHMNYMLQLKDPKGSPVPLQEYFGDGVRELEMLISAFRVENPDDALKMNQSTRQFLGQLTKPKRRSSSEK